MEKGPARNSLPLEKHGWNQRKFVKPLDTIARLQMPETLE